MKTYNLQGFGEDMGMRNKLSIILTAGLLTACGGGGSGGSPEVENTNPGGTSPDTSESKTGIFSDSPVAGVTYLTSPGGNSGVTNALGEYQFQPGDTVQFSIGGIQFPSVTAKGKVTPLDMGGAGATLSTPSVINVLRLLQTLDEDGDPDNGITITEATATTLIDTVIDFTAATFESEASAAASSVNKTLVTENDAVAHFEGSLRSDLLGSWIFVEPEGIENVLTFFGDNLYVLAHSAADDGDQGAGTAEYGSYTWDPVTGDFSVSIIRESDGSGGFYDSSDPSASEGNQLTLADGVMDFSLADGEAQFTAIDDPNNDLVGGWYLPAGVNDSVLLTYLDDSNYVLVQTDNTENYASDLLVQVSSEWNTYTLDSSNNSYSVGVPRVETDGPGGFYNAEGNEDENGPKLLLKPGGQLIYQPNPQESVAFGTVSPFDAQLVDVNGNSTSAPVKRVYGVFNGGEAASYNFVVPASSQFERFAPLLVNDTVEVNLEANGTGTVAFSQTSSNNIEWSVGTNGVLTFTETTATADEWFWDIIPIAGNPGSAIIAVSTPEGQSSRGSARFLTLVKDGPAVIAQDFISGPYLLTETITAVSGRDEANAIEGTDIEGVDYGVFCLNSGDTVGSVESFQVRLDFSPESGSFVTTFGTGPDADSVTGILSEGGQLTFSEAFEETATQENFLSRNNGGFVGQYNFDTRIVEGTYTSDRETEYTPENIIVECTLTYSWDLTPIE